MNKMNTIDMIARITNIKWNTLIYSMPEWKIRLYLDMQKLNTVVSKECLVARSLI